MSATEPEEFGAAYWEDRYGKGLGASRSQTSPSLLVEAGGLVPGRALDAGCGVGGDALWLAAHGWRVTAVEVSPTALEQGRRAAEAAGPVFAERIEWVRADLTTWEPEQPAYDLVTSHYVHVPGPPEALFRRLASWVAPGGSLLVVGHAHGDHPAGALVGVEQVVGCLPPEQWSVVVAEPRTHTLRQPDGGEVVLHDVVVHARRAAG